MKLEIGKRVLVKSKDELVDGLVSEFSPNGQFVRIGWQWHRANQVEVMDELPALPEPKLCSSEPPAGTPLTLAELVSTRAVPPAPESGQPDTAQAKA
jgi:hypothetical protein